MHIGFDISQTGSNKAGCGYFAHAMIQSMLAIAPEHRYSLFPSFGDFYFDANMPVQCPYSGRDVHYGPRHLSREAAALFWSNSELEAALGKPDVIHANNFWCPTQFVSSRLIYTLYDMSFVVDPAWTTEINRAACFDGVCRFSTGSGLGSRNFGCLACALLERVPPLCAGAHSGHLPVFKVHRCVGPRAATQDARQPARQRLLVERGHHCEPRKNQRRLAQAYARYLALGVSAQVPMTGYVSDDELIWLYRNCYANLYPSLFEGFGLPVLEGMQFGAPTLASNSTSMPEVAGDVAILLAPQDTEGWTQAMLRLAANRNERDQLSLASLKRAARFDWKRSAAALLQLYEEALAAPKR